MSSPRITFPRPRAAAHLAAGAAALLALGLAAPVPAAALPAAAAQAEPLYESTAPLTISPSAGGAGTSVTVRASCRPQGPATSEAFRESITLRQVGHDQWVGTGSIRQNGLSVGRSYTVTVRCADGVSLSGRFTYTAGTPSGGASAGFGGESAREGDSQATALAIGGGVALAGAAGYLFLSRRRRISGHRY